MAIKTNEVTGRDDFLIAEALAFAIEGWSRLPDVYRPKRNITSMKVLLASRLDDCSLALSQREARRLVSVLLETVPWRSGGPRGSLP